MDNNNNKYLYGAAVQGIQNFIFQTNKLKNIVKASEKVENICSKKIKKIFEENKLNYDEKNCILHAAGNIKYLFDKKEDCEKIVRTFPKEISEFAPGITVSQAVVIMKDDSDLENAFKDAVNELEKRLRIQRNKQMRSATLGLLGIKRNTTTGLPELKGNDGEKPSYKQLCEKAFGEENIKDDAIAYDIEDLTKGNDWIAIIHADGNGLGQVVQAIGKKKDKFKQFSEKLDKATIDAAIEAYKAVKKERKDDFLSENKKIPIRPIVLGGDDLTVICRADIALDYTTAFIENFEKNTREYMEYNDKESLLDGAFKDEKDKHLTACAGIAYIKSSFPFYYGYELAEALCSRAKKDAKDSPEIKEGKELPKSCLMFHKVQGSFTEDYNEIAKRELKPQENISFEFGPYYINQKKDDSNWTVSELISKTKELNNEEGNAIKSHLRQWMSLLHENPEMAGQKLQRLKSMTSNKEFVETVTKGRQVDKDDEKIIKYPVYDILALHTINTQKTKENN